MSQELTPEDRDAWIAAITETLHETHPAHRSHFGDGVGSLNDCLICGNQKVLLDIIAVEREAHRQELQKVWVEGAEFVIGQTDPENEREIRSEMKAYNPYTTPTTNEG